MSIFKREADKAMVLSTDQVAAPMDELVPNGMARAPELYLRPMQTSQDMCVKNTHQGAVRRK